MPAESAILTMRLMGNHWFKFVTGLCILLHSHVLHRHYANYAEWIWLLHSPVSCISVSFHKLLNRAIYTERHSSSLHCLSEWRCIALTFLICFSLWFCLLFVQKILRVPVKGLGKQMLANCSFHVCNETCLFVQSAFLHWLTGAGGLTGWLSWVQNS